MGGRGWGIGKAHGYHSVKRFDNISISFRRSGRLLLSIFGVEMRHIKGQLLPQKQLSSIAKRCAFKMKKDHRVQVHFLDSSRSFFTVIWPEDRKQRE